MDRQIIYAGQIPLETDLLNTNVYSFIGLGKLAEAVLGKNTLVNGLACTPTPGVMGVNIGPGEIYALGPVDGTAYSSLPADTNHSLVKQGLMPDVKALACPAPLTPGYSIVYVVQARYQDADTDPITLPYYNASNPSQGLAGPNNSGSVQYTARRGQCVVGLAQGSVAALTGSEQTPAPDNGYVGLYAITVSSASTSITAYNIAPLPNAPFINEKLTDKISQATADARYLAASNTALSGTPTAPTPAQSNNSTQIATTAFVQAATAPLAPLASPALTGNPTAPTLAASDNGTGIATTAFVQAAIAPLAPLASPALTGNPTAPTLAASDNGTGIATTAFVQTLASNLSSTLSAATTAAAPAGTVSFFAMGNAPTGWLKADGSLVSRTSYSNLFSAIVSSAGFTAQGFTVSLANPAVFTKTAHGFTGGERLRLFTTGALPTGLSLGVDYFVQTVDVNTFRLTTAAGLVMATTGTQSGTHTYLQSWFGLGDGSTSFALPDLRGEFVRGWDLGRGVDAGRSLGAVQDQDWKGFYMMNTGNNTYSYSHGEVYHGKSTTAYNGNTFVGQYATPAAALGTKWDTSEIRPRNIALLACIKY